ncbi:cytochrome P450 [Ganoderma sinense ZZ0214-1]|uniref:Cytochrome P450 n=1 Tax=Ganoderma sinense ZZ0214-1 TaxID=1077348 RepID=A0A2G8RMI0_9APHY|nr:cytochrome P450 [Ganoderma sinense ZZ0214-1]
MDSVRDVLPLPLVAVLLLVVHLYLRRSRLAARSRGHPLPPGPPRLPILGNLFDIPKDVPWEVYRNLNRQYGNIISLQVMDQIIVVIDDVTIAVELFERRSAIYSSRPTSNVIALSGWTQSLPLMPYGQWWRSHRRMFWQRFHPGVVSRQFPLQEDAVRQLLLRLLNTPEHFSEHVRYTLSAAMVKSTYGVNVAEEDDKYIATAEAGSATNEILLHAPTALEFFPLSLLDHIPRWIPGLGVLHRVKEGRDAVNKARLVPWTDGKALMASSNHFMLTLVSAVVEELSHLDDDSAAAKEEVAVNVAASAYTAGVETLHSAITAFLLAMSLYPDVQRKVQEELDKVISPNRLPELGDYDSLPYTKATVKEALRWHSCSNAHDVYNGYFIPEGSVVMFNAWATFQNPETYPEPHKFIPERYLGGTDQFATGCTDPTTIVFGYGRRICPGRYLADAIMFLYIASILHTFDITPPVDESGNPIRIEPRATTGISSNLVDCRCQLKPRSPGAEFLIRGYRKDEALALSG